MGPSLCCDNMFLYCTRRLDHDDKFNTFITWLEKRLEGSEPVIDDYIIPFLEGAPYAVQFVRHVGYGLVKSIRYFVPKEGQEDQAYLEITESAFSNANFVKLNSWKVSFDTVRSTTRGLLTFVKDFKCKTHNKFFEINLYQKDPINKHHWRVYTARPADQIDV